LCVVFITAHGPRLWRPGLAGWWLRRRRTGAAVVVPLPPTPAVRCLLGPPPPPHPAVVQNLEKEDDVRKFVVSREAIRKKGGKPFTKRPKIQRLVTPVTLQRKRHLYDAPTPGPLHRPTVCFLSSDLLWACMDVRVGCGCLVRSLDEHASMGHGTSLSRREPRGLPPPVVCARVLGVPSSLGFPSLLCTCALAPDVNAVTAPAPLPRCCAVFLVLECGWVGGRQRGAVAAGLLAPRGGGAAFTLHMVHVTQWVVCSTR
jgi:hypothetical protein